MKERGERKLNELQRRIDELQKRNAAFDEGQQGGMNADADRHNGLFGPYKYHLDKNGRIASVAEALRADRYGARGTKEENQARHRQEADDRKAKRLSDKNEALLSKSEREWLNKYNEMRQREKADKQLENLQK